MEIKSLYEEYKQYFNVGTCVGVPHFNGNNTETELIKKHFNLLVAENCTKMMYIYRGLNDFNWKEGDDFVRFCQENNKLIRWHNFVWHAQTAPWIFLKEGVPVNMKDFFQNNINPADYASKELIEKRLQHYIQTVCDRYKGKIYSYDVVNECISDKLFALRTREDHSLWQEVMGPDYVSKAFLWAREADPDAELVINDYNLETIPQKRQAMFDFVKEQKSKGIPIDTIGLQMHINIFDSVPFIEETIEMFGKLGVNVIVTEMEISLYRFEEKEKKIIDADLLKVQADKYYECFEVFRRQAQKGILKDVVLWGVQDNHSWKNDFPVPGRGDAPLLFDKDGKPKPCFNAIVK